MVICDLKNKEIMEKLDKLLAEELWTQNIFFRWFHYRCVVI